MNDKPRIIWITQFPLSNVSFGEVTTHLLSRLDEKYNFYCLSFGYSGQPLGISNFVVLPFSNSSEIDFYWNEIKPNLVVLFHAVVALPKVMSSGRFKERSILYVPVEGYRVPHSYLPYFTYFDRILVTSNWSKEALRRDKIDSEILYHGVDTNFFSPYVRKNPKFTYGYLGSNDIRKQVPTILDAFRLVKGEKQLNLATPIQGYIDLGDVSRELNIVPKFQKAIGRGIPVSRDKIREFYYSLNAYVGIGTEGFGLPCLIPSTKIVTEDGLKEIERIKKGDRVLTHTGKFRKVLEVYQGTWKGKLIEIKPCCFNTPIQLTPDHLVKVVRPKKEGRSGTRNWWQEGNWIPAKEVRKGDAVIFPIPKQSFNQRFYDLKDFDQNLLFDENYVWYKTGYSRKTGELSKIKRYIPINEDLATLIGIYITEGSTNSKQLSSIEFSLGNEPTLASDILERMEKVFGVKGTIIKRGNKTRIIFSSKILAKFFSTLCGLGARNKKIPKEILYGPSTLLMPLKDYILKGDGSFYKERWSLSTSSSELAKEFQIVLLRLGYRSGLHHNRNELTVRVGRKEKKVHSNKSWVSEDNLILLVRDVKKIEYLGNIFNLEVEEDLTYTTESFLVHNSLESAATGIPNIALDYGASKEILGDCSLYVKPCTTQYSQLGRIGVADYKALSKKMQELKDNPKLCEELGKKGIERAKQFTWEDAVKKLDKIIEEELNCQKT